MRFPRSPLLLALLVVAPVDFLAFRDDGIVAAPSAHALEAKLLAPCCFGGTIDVHDSPVAHELKEEIERRVASGEATSSIEANIVERYGPKVEAMPESNLFTRAMVVALNVAAILGALLLTLLLRWRTMATPEPKTTEAIPGTPDDYDKRLDEELADET